MYIKRSNSNLTAGRYVSVFSAVCLYVVVICIVCLADCYCCWHNNTWPIFACCVVQNTTGEHSTRCTKLAKFSAAVDSVLSTPPGVATIESR